MHGGLNSASYCYCWQVDTNRRDLWPSSGPTPGPEQASSTQVKKNQ